MKKQKVALNSLSLIGLTARTNNKDEMNPDTSKIAALAGTYWDTHISNQFKHRKKPGVTYLVYTDYESDENGEYTFFIGEEVESSEGQDVQFKPLIIPAGNYQRFTTPPGKIPDIVLSTWQQIWQMTPENLGGKRQYLADFEIHDQRAKDPNHAVVDIYIGI